MSDAPAPFIPIDAPGPVCVLGLGLIGGSVLRRVADAGGPAFGYNRGTATVAAATADGYRASDDLSGTLAAAEAAGALVVVATPAPTVPAMFAAIAEHAPTCAVTDVVSVKQEVAAAAATAGLTHRFVGGHPMAGTAESGWAATDPDLFAGAIWVVQTDDGVDPAIWRRVTALAHACGADVVAAASDEHDRAVAAISHLPHVLAATLAQIGGAGGELSLRLGAGSFRDGTRVMATAPDLVRAMCEANAPALLDATSEAIDTLIAARDALRDTGDTGALFRAGHRDRLRFEAITARRVPLAEPVGPDGWEARLRAAGRRGHTWRDVPGQV